MQEGGNIKPSETIGKTGCYHIVDVHRLACFVQMNVQDGHFHPGVICVPAVVHVTLEHLKPHKHVHQKSRQERLFKMITHHINEQDETLDSLATNSWSNEGVFT